MSPSQKSDDLLNDYIQNKSETAFSELVRRNLNLVYATALRRTNGDAALAEDIAQTVFIDLARKASTLPRSCNLPGWLYRHTCYITASTIRSEHRRRQRESQSMNGQPSDNPDFMLAPFLEGALDGLPHRDRDALILRYFDDQSFAKLGQALGISEDAARMRVDRALERMRLILLRTGVTSTSSAIALALTREGSLAAPAALAASISVGALQSLTNIAPASISLLGKLPLLQVKPVFVGLLAVSLAVIVVLQQSELGDLRTQNANLAGSLWETEARAISLFREASPQPSKTSPPNDEHRELLRLRGQIGLLRQELEMLHAARSRTAETALQDFTVPLSADSWRDFGFSTPERALMTQVWAQFHNQQRFFDSIAVPAGAHTNTLDHWRESFQVFPNELKSLRVVAVNPIAEDIVEVQEETETKAGKKQMGLKVAQRFENEWKILVESMPLSNGRHGTQFVAKWRFQDGVYRPFQGWNEANP